MKSRGRPTTIHLDAQAGLLAYLKAKPWAYQDEMSLYLFDDWGGHLANSVYNLTNLGIAKERGYGTISADTQ